MKWSGKISLALATVATLFGVAGTPSTKAQEKKPNILVIMGDDVGWFNVGAYHRYHVWKDAKSGQARLPGHDVHRLLRRG